MQYNVIKIRNGDDEMLHEQRINLAKELEKKRKMRLNGDSIMVSNGLVYVNETPMTWDYFTHIYLLNVNVMNGGK